MKEGNIVNICVSTNRTIVSKVTLFFFNMFFSDLFVVEIIIVSYVTVDLGDW